MTFHADADHETFEKLLAESDLVAVDFYATWCAPCKAYSPKFSRLDREVRRRAPDAKVAFASVDIDLQQDLARRFSVKSVPTTVVVGKKRGLFGGVKTTEALRFSGDKPWPELLRDVLAVVER